AGTVCLCRRAAEPATAFGARAGLERVLALSAAAAAAAGSSLTAFEFMPRLAIDFVLKHVANTRDPFATPAPWYALIDVSGLKPDGSAERQMLAILEAAAERGLIVDATLTSSVAQARDFWPLRDLISQAQKHEGGNVKNDVSVPIASIPAFIARADALVLGMPGGASLGVRPFWRRQCAL